MIKVEYKEYDIVLITKDPVAQLAVESSKSFVDYTGAKKYARNKFNDLIKETMLLGGNIRMLSYTDYEIEWISKVFLINNNIYKQQTRYHRILIS